MPLVKTFLNLAFKKHLTKGIYAYRKRRTRGLGCPRSAKALKQSGRGGSIEESG
jgi:hypothetical protein